jgi:hypothetical protein
MSKLTAQLDGVLRWVAYFIFLFLIGKGTWWLMNIPGQHMPPGYITERRVPELTGLGLFASPTECVTRRPMAEIQELKRRGERIHLNDDWDRPFWMHCPDGKEFEVRSAGEDGLLDTQDDFVSINKYPWDVSFEADVKRRTKPSWKSPDRR